MLLIGDICYLKNISWISIWNMQTLIFLLHLNSCFFIRNSECLPCVIWGTRWRDERATMRLFYFVVWDYWVLTKTPGVNRFSKGPEQGIMKMTKPGSHSVYNCELKKPNSIEWHTFQQYLHHLHTENVNNSTILFTPTSWKSQYAPISPTFQNVDACLLTERRLCPLRQSFTPILTNIQR